MKRSLLLSLPLFVSFACAAPAFADDAMPAASPPFEQMLAHVYQDSPQLRAERENLRILDERVSEASAGFRPQLAFNGAIGEGRVSENNARWQYGADHTLALVATQPIYNGATIGQWHAAKKRVLEGRARLLATEQKVLFTAISAWMEMCEKEQLLLLNRDNQKLSRSYLNATQQRLQAGDGTQTDIAVAQSRAADGETRFAMAQSAFDGARATFQRVTGLPPQEAELPSLPTELPKNQDEAVILAKNNPEMQQADYEVAATSDDIDTATGARWPYIYLRGSLSDESAEDLGLARLRSDSITLNASFPLYAGGAEYAREREAKIAHEKSRFDSLTVSRNVDEEAALAWGHFNAARSIIDASDRSADASDRALAGINEEQKHGTRTLTEVLDAQAQALNAKITALQAEADLRMEAFRLMAAVGKLTARDLNLPTRLYEPADHYDDVAARWFGTSIKDNDTAEATDDR